MLVALENNLNELKKQLLHKGYRVITLKKNSKADAVLYDSSMYNTGLNNIFNSGIQSIGNSSEGVLIIDVKNKSIEEIDRILKKRTYSPLL